jgi:mannose/fructose-specific phosphotransferase system component IIA
VRAVFYGVNLPLLIEFVFLQDLPFDEFSEALLKKSRGALGVHS